MAVAPARSPPGAARCVSFPEKHAGRLRLRRPLSLSRGPRGPSPASARLLFVSRRSALPANGKRRRVGPRRGSAGAGFPELGGAALLWLRGEGRLVSWARRREGSRAGGRGLSRRHAWDRQAAHRGGAGGQSPGERAEEAAAAQLGPRSRWWGQEGPGQLRQAPRPDTNLAPWCRRAKPGAAQLRPQASLQGGWVSAGRAVRKCRHVRRPP